VPAVVVPVVLLVGFAGCDRLFGLDYVKPNPPTIVSAEGQSGTVIRLKWTYDPAAGFEFERTKLPEQPTQLFNVPGSPHEHDDDNEGQGLEPNTSYQYRVRAIRSGDGEKSEWSGSVIGSTLPFETTFAWTAEEQARCRDAPGLQGFCTVQRIEAARLSRSGTLVKLTLRASSAGNASIERIYISKPDPAPGKDPYDSDADLTPVSSAVIVPANNSVTLPAINYHLDAQQPLLIAIDFSAALPSDIKVVDNVLGTEASTYYKVASAESAIGDRSGFTPVDRMFIVEKIEVA
jgi:hypothetical protein